jgi:hypothetical protein
LLCPPAKNAYDAVLADNIPAYDEAEPWLYRLEEDIFQPPTVPADAVIEEELPPPDPYPCACTHG